ncbi:(DL)-glycerol-3-phosphatase 2-like isoform X4 [Phoenix dactylifera]|uniref:glycerol-1-phosphatase n=1 Tax=Phoenix dactylifera TaxID=42345 RepID=A0A8B7C1H3_PHODC|nr:(DL)-glycerol-3-phosphatase 2-like isoform X4 [Phoenix dactylifera]
MAMASPSSAGLEGETERVSPPKGAITHVIFDFDGTLIDTQPFYTLVQERILSRFGKPYDPSIEAKLMGKKPTESARIFVEETGLAGLLTPEGFLEERNAMLTELFPSSQLLPGVKRLVSHLHANGIPMCVATGTYKHNFEVLTQNHGETFAMMHHVVLGDDPEVKKRKPAPDVFLIALKRFEGNVDPSEVLVFEDAPSGVAAAKNAGMSAVMLSDAGPDASAYKQADQVLSSLLDFKPSHWGLPPFKDTVI